MDFQKKIPTGKLNRSRIIAVSTAKAGIKKIGYLSKKPFLSKAAKDREGKLNDEEIAKTLFKSLSVLRGTALKAAQMLSMELELIPKAYRKEMCKATSRVPPLNRALIRKTITRELGGPPEKIFRSFESTPFAAASLGQVHRAISPDGDELAIKIQYPGIDESVSSDIDMLKILLRPSKYYAIFSPAFGEIQERISEELDYSIEAKNTTWFKEHLEIDKVVIPRVYPKFSTTHVLTTEMIHGLHLEQWLNTNPTQAIKDHYGQLFVDLFNYTTHQKAIIHADPNTGNYIFMNDGRLGLIDFGCVKRLDSDLIKALGISAEKDFGNNPEKLKTFYHLAGIHFDKHFGHEDFQGFIHRWIDWILRPETEEWFRFYEGSEYFHEGMALLKEFYSYIQHFDGKFIYFGRAHYGLRRLLQRLGARVKMRPIS